MTKAELLPILLTNLNMNIPSTGRTAIQDKIVTELNLMMDSAIESISAIGIVLPDGTIEQYSSAEADLIITYSAYLYRNRIDGSGITPMLKMMLNNMLFHQKGRINE